MVVAFSVPARIAKTANRYIHLGYVFMHRNHWLINYCTSSIHQNFKVLYLIPKCKYTLWWILFYLCSAVESLRVTSSFSSSGLQKWFQWRKILSWWRHSEMPSCRGSVCNNIRVVWTERKWCRNPRCNWSLKRMMIRVERK